MRILFVDGAAGLAGDMFLGALLDLGWPEERLREVVAALGVPAGIEVGESRRGGIRGLSVEVRAPGDRGHRHLRDFERTLGEADLPPRVKDLSRRLLRRIFEAEAGVHGMEAETVHLHELGSLDTLVDVVGAVAGVLDLAPDRVCGSPVNVGGGWVDSEHGTLAAPAPATALLLRGAPTFSDDSGFERTTPTGAVLSGLVDEFDGWPEMTPERVGYGLGAREAKPGGRPNALRMVLGRAPDAAGSRVLVVRAVLDDMVPEIAPHLLGRLLESGARDAYLTPVQMKRGRPGFEVTVLADPKNREEVVATLFAESTTLGVRITGAERETLERRSAPVPTPWGDVRVKVGFRRGVAVNRAPEFEDARRVATAAGAPLKEVYRHALAAAPDAVPGSDDEGLRDSEADAAPSDSDASETGPAPGDSDFASSDEVARAAQAARDEPDAPEAAVASNAPDADDREPSR